MTSEKQRERERESQREAQRKRERERDIWPGGRVSVKGLTLSIASGEVYTWGAGSNGRLGHGHERDRFTPLLINGLKGKIVVQVACGDYHTAALTGSPPT